MRILVLCLAQLFAAGCASNISYWTTPSLGGGAARPSAERPQLRCIEASADDSRKIIADWRGETDAPPVAYVSYFPEASRGDIETVTAIADAALLMEISYCNTEQKNVRKKREDAAFDYRALGFDAAYFHPRYYFFLHDPNLFLLGRPGSNELTVVFTGTEIAFNPFDIIQDLRTGLSYKGRKDGKPYVPRGHAGFRSSFRNVIRKDFFENAMTFTALNDHCDRLSLNTQPNGFDDSPRVSLANFICRNEIRNGNPNEKIKITVIGHSLGAGIGQMSLGAFEGLTWRREKGVDAQIEKPSEDWPFVVKTAYFFAPPLALYPRDRDCNKHQGAGPIDVYERNTLHKRTFAVIRDGDMVPAIWNPIKRSAHCVEGQHFGTFVRIPRGEGTAFIESVDWENAEPHRPRNYRSAIDKALEALRNEGSDLPNESPVLNSPNLP